MHVVRVCQLLHPSEIDQKFWFAQPVVVKEWSSMV